MKNLRLLILLCVLFLFQTLMASNNMDRPQYADFENGIYAATLTPLNEDLSCNSDALASHCLDLMQRGCKGVVLFGTTGEGPSFSIKERVEVLKQVIDAGIDPKKIIMANGGANLPDTIDLAKVALRHNVTTLLICPPSFFKNIPEEGVIAFYREVIHKINDPRLKVLLYHIPQFSGVPITLSIIETLSREFPSIVIGIKESEGNLPFTKEIIDRFPGFKVFVGNEGQIIEAVHYGASGSICGIANFYPEMICSLYEQGQRSFCENPRELEAFYQALKGHFFIPAFKAIMETTKGTIWHSVRPPLTPLNTLERKDFIAQLEHLP